MSQTTTRLFTQIAGPPLRRDLPSGVSEFMAGTIERMDYVLEEIESSQPEYIAGVYVDLVDEASINAVSFCDGTHEFVGIHAGLGLLLPTIYSWLLSHPTVFPDVGDATREKTPPRFDHGMLRRSGRFSEIPESVWNDYVSGPLDPVRAWYAISSSIVAMDFLLWHELAHLNRCHIPYLSSMRAKSDGPSSWREVNPRLQSEEVKLRNILEADADGVATRVLAGAPIVNGLEKARFAALGDAEVKGLSWDWSYACVLWMRAVAILFHLLAIVEDDQGISDPARTHPHPDIRLQLVVNFSWQQWQKVLPETVFRELTPRVARDVVDLFRQGILPSPASRLLKSYNRQQFGDTVRELWNGIFEHADGLNDLTGKRWDRLGKMRTRYRLRRQYK
jgi:hypothetical protein